MNSSTPPHPSDDWEYHDPEDEQNAPLLPVPGDRWWSKAITKVLSKKRQHAHDIHQKWMDYYHGIYRELPPDPIVFQQLVKQYGFCHIPNPYREGHQQYYQFCADGVTLADVDFVLGYWQRRHLSGAPLASSESSDNHSDIQLVRDIESRWPSLYEHRFQSMPSMSVAVSQQHNEHEWERQQEAWLFKGCACLAYLFVSPINNWRWISSILHRDNIGLLCKIVYDNAPSEMRDQLVSAWLSSGWITKAQHKWFITRPSEGN